MDEIDEKPETIADRIMICGRCDRVYIATDDRLVREGWWRCEWCGIENGLDQVWSVAI